jgi:Glycosyl hydrolase family 20, catalytic domain
MNGKSGRQKSRLCLLLLALLAGGSSWLPPKNFETWRGVHLWLDCESSAQQLVQTLPALAQAGANVVVIEVNYSFEFPSHPELRLKNCITQKTAHALAAAARRSGIRLIPEFNCLGHQSFAGQIGPLLKTHPDFSETPPDAMQRTNFYSLSWCPRAPGLNPIVFSLIDDLATGFEADAIHVGMDEVYYIGEDDCPRCRGQNPAQLFAAQVNALHAHLVGERHLNMLMWADRVIGPKFQGYSRFDNQHNDLSAAMDLIPRDIVMCDWHYEWRKNYPSIAYLADKGFRVWPSGFMPLKAARQLSDFSLAHRTNVVGYLATTWNETSITNSPNWPPIREILPQWK